MRKRSVILAFLISIPLAAAAQQQSGTFEIETVDSMNISDAQRGKDVVVRIHYPKGNGPFPVIVFSHGLGGNKDAFGVIARHWASHGYVTIHPTHDDRGVALGTGGMNPPPEKVTERVRDVVAVMDGLKQIEDRVSPLQGKLDRNRMGAAGHSYGSFVSMLAGGVRADMGAEKLKSLADARVKCIVPIAPGGRGDYGLTDESWKNLKVPALFFTGSRDTRSGRPVEWRQEPYQFSPNGDKYLVHIEGAAHNSYGSESDPSNAANYVKAASVAFWDSCLKGSAAGKAYLLKPEGFAAFAGKAATLSAK